MGRVQRGWSGSEGGGVMERIGVVKTNSTVGEINYKRMLKGKMLYELLVFLVL